MNKVIRKAILITIFAILSVSSVFASKDVITLHLVANVPERNYVNVSDDRINVSSQMTESTSQQTQTESVLRLMTRTAA